MIKTYLPFAFSLSREAHHYWAKIKEHGQDVTEIVSNHFIFMDILCNKDFLETLTSETVCPIDVLVLTASLS